MSPRLAAVFAAINSVNLNRGPDRAMVARIDRDIGDLGRTGEALLGDIDREFLPLFPAVNRTKDPGRLGAGKDHVTVAGMPRHRPNLSSVHRRFDKFPVRAIVITAIKPRLGSGENP